MTGTEGGKGGTREEGEVAEGGGWRSCTSRTGCHEPGTNHPSSKEKNEPTRVRRRTSEPPGPASFQPQRRQHKGPAPSLTTGLLIENLSCVQKASSPYPRGDATHCSSDCAPRPCPRAQPASTTGHARVSGRPPSPQGCGAVHTVHTTPTHRELTASCSGPRLVAGIRRGKLRLHRRCRTSKAAGRFEPAGRYPIALGHEKNSQRVREQHRYGKRGMRHEASGY